MRPRSVLRIKYSPFDWFDVEGNFSYDNGKATFSQFRDKGYRATTSGFGAGQTQNPGAIFTGASGFNAYNTSVNVVARRTIVASIFGGACFVDRTPTAGAGAPAQGD